MTVSHYKNQMVMHLPRKIHQNRKENKIRIINESALMLTIIQASVVFYPTWEEQYIHIEIIIIS